MPQKSSQPSTLPPDPCLCLFRGSPSWASRWLQDQGIDFEVIHPATRADLWELAACDCSELKTYLLLDYTEALILTFNPKSRLVIPNHTLLGEDIKLKWSTRMPPWYCEATVSLDTPLILRKLESLPAALQESLLQHLRCYPQAYADLMVLDDSLVELWAESCLPLEFGLYRWLKRLATQPVAAVKSLEPRDLAAWFSRYPDCVAANFLAKTCAGLWVYLVIFIDHALRLNEGWKSGLLRLAYWLAAAQAETKKPMLKLGKRKNATTFWFSPNAQAHNLLSIYLR